MSDAFLFRCSLNLWGIKYSVCVYIFLSLENTQEQVYLQSIHTVSEIVKSYRKKKNVGSVNLNDVPIKT